MIILQELQNEYKNDLINHNFVVTNIKVKKKDNSLLIEILNKRENKYLNVKFTNYGFVSANNDVDLIGCTVNNIYCNGYFKSFGRTVLLGSVLVLTKGDLTIQIYSNQE